ncbi:ThiF family adenylyltransferase [Muriicola sp. E247]|uniref:ThiF family adenylyltransferase n=1 Tax=Muriicola sp. E247 TaxID=3242730 RepID=UPI0035243716
MKQNRYIRQTSLKDFGPDKQQALRQARVLVVGVGGLGIPVLQYLNAMGVGCLGMVEQDVVEWSNLQRQVLYTESDLGKSKIQVAEEKLREMNSETELICHDTFLTRTNALEIISDYDLVVDASDNFPTRYLINDACVILNKPFVSGAIYGFEGQVSVFNYKEGPTYRCLFPSLPEKDNIPDCNTNGVLGVIPGIIGSFQALEAVKVITDMPGVLSGILMLYNGFDQSIRKVKFPAVVKNKDRTQLESNYNQPVCDSIPEVSFKRMLQEISRDSPKISLIDVRSTEELRMNPIEKAKHIPMQLLADSVDEFTDHQTIFFICQSGKRSKDAVRKLLPLLPDRNLYSVKGGIEAMKNGLENITKRDESDLP